MSHQTVVQNKFTSLEAIRRAAKELGMSVTENVAMIRGYYNPVRPEVGGEFALVLSHPRCPFDLGVYQCSDGTFNTQGDYFKLGEFSLTDIVGPQGCKLTQLAGVHAATMEANALGYSVEREEVKGEIRLTLENFEG